MSLRLYVEQPLAGPALFSLPPGPARHVQVRRMQPGDPLRLFDGSGVEWRAEVVEMGRREVSVRLLEARAVDRELPIAVTLAIGMPANERMDLLVEKAAELGASALQPLHCARSVLRLAGERAERRLQHWQAVANAACEQCGRARLMQVMPVKDLADWLAAPAPAAAVRWLLSAGAARPTATPVQPLVLLSGPEGGLADDERQAATAAGFLLAGLGPRILRADTAPLAALAWVALSAG